MIANPCYTTITLYGQSYLLPFGQALADKCAVLQVNDTVLTILKECRVEIEESALLATLCDTYLPSDSEKEDFLNDIKECISDLKAAGVLWDAPTGGSGSLVGGPDAPAGRVASPADRMDSLSPVPYEGTAPSAVLTIAGISISLWIPEEVLNRKFSDFCLTQNSLTDSGFADSEFSDDRAVTGFRVTLADSSEISSLADTYAGFHKVLVSPDLTVLEDEACFLLHYPAFRYLSYAKICKETGDTVFFFTGLPADGSVMISPQIPEEFYQALRLPFLYTACRTDVLMLHSASFLYKGKVYCISAPAHTGKSTHVNYWVKEFGVPVINGDLNLLTLSHCDVKDNITDTVSADQILVQGTPWCGTSGVADSGAYPFGGVLFLEQADRDFVTFLSPRDAALLLISRSINPAFWEKMLQKRARVARILAGSDAVFGLLHATNSPASAHAAKDYIDGVL